MTGNLRNAWSYTPADLWEPLAAHSGKDVAGNTVTAPEDLFSDLAATTDDYLGVATPESQLEEIRNDPAAARIRFLSIKGTDFASESDIVFFLEAASDVIADYEIPGFEDYYKRLLREYLHKYNLRYRLDDPFILRFLLPGSFSNLYAELQRLNAGNPHFTTLLGDFEHCFNLYIRSQHDTDLRNCVKAAATYAEGLASATSGYPENRNTLGALAHGLADWPHDKVKESLVQLYGFCSDYPALRHSGHPDHARRTLAARDATALSILLLSFSGYLTPQVDEHAVLGV